MFLKCSQVVLTLLAWEQVALRSLMCPLPVPHLLSAIVRIQWVGVYEGTFEKQKVLVK